MDYIANKGDFESEGVKMYTEKQVKKIMCQELSEPECKMMCVGSQCAAWRWVPDNYEDEEHITGYCGKAGKP